MKLICLKGGIGNHITQRGSLGNTIHVDIKDAACFQSFQQVI